jgi:hypothetical protein
MRQLPVKFLSSWIAVGLITGVFIATPGNAGDEHKFNQPGNILITDQFNNRVIEMAHDGDIVWHFGLGPNDSSPKSIIGTNDAERAGDLTLMSGTGIPAGVDSIFPNGVADNRVILVNREGEIVWQYGTFGVTGSDLNQLNTPVQNTFLPNGNILITDQGNERIIEVRRSDKQIVWQYGMTGVSGIGPNQLNNPNAAELLANGHILISDENNNRAIEVTHTTPSQIIMTFTAGGTASGMAFASRLPDGNTLLTDSNNSRIVEVDKSDNVIFAYFTNDPHGNTSPLPTRAVKLANGNILISDQFNDRVIDINAEKQIVKSYGTLNTPGFNRHNASVMNAPYSAYVIGDYTGITPPFGFGNGDN